MKKTAFVLTAVLAAVLLIQCQQPQNTLAAPEFSQQLAKLDNEQLIDVRTPEEYAGGHIEGAVNIDFYGEAFDNAISQLDKTRPVYVYCKVGGRSAKAAASMRTKGFTQVVELQGGFDAWNNANFPVSVSNTPATPKPADGKGNEVVVDKPFPKSVYLEEVRKDRYTLVDFAAGWCGPCRILAPRIDQVQKEMNNGFTLMKVDADRDTEICDSLRITALPTLVFYKNGKQLWRHTGLLEKSSLDQMIRESMTN
ncbi:MAG: thioredoxin domain-containing protein [Bacteroidia bacterium]|jgi:thioredoxin|nr:thioredoxin domain-containing protein [Bacteroidia bacterium]